MDGRMLDKFRLAAGQEETANRNVVELAANRCRGRAAVTYVALL